MANTITGGSTESVGSSQFTMTFSEMQDQVYFLTDQAPGDLFPRTLAKRYINQGLYEVAGLAGMPEVQESFTTPLSVTNTISPTNPLLTRNSLVVSHVRFDDTLLEHIDEDDIGDKTTEGTPSYYYIDGSHLHLYPVPDDTGNTIVVEYVKEPTMLSADDDVSELTPQAQELACVWAAMKFKQKDDEFAARDRLAADFADGIARITGPRTGFYK